MEIKKVIQDSADEVQLNAINSEAFPEEERIPTPMLLDMARTGELDIFEAFEGETMIGFFAVFPHEECGYIFYLATEKSKRGKGYGSRMLKEMFSLYSNHQIILDLETIDENAPNFAQRISRKQFYLHNGMYESGYLLSYLGMTFEVLCSSLPFEKQAFEDTLDAVVKFAAKSGKGHFDPVLSPK